jgi:catechol 2,3-dioxygenase-like lactoylglutathione lyase family enzyme
MTVAFSHLGICVSDLERSVRFYCDGLGFEPTQLHHVGAEFAALMEIDGVSVRSQFLRRDHLSIELLFYDAPGFVGEPVRRPVNQLGLTHLNFRVDDVEAVSARLRELGGTVLDHTRTTFGPEMDFVYCTDPDGTRIELMKLPA